VPADDALRLAFLGDPNSIHTRRWMAYFAERGHAVTLLDGFDVPIAPGLHGQIAVEQYLAHGRHRAPILSLLAGRQALRRVLGDPQWAFDPALDAAAGRLARRAQLNTAIAEWTRTRTPHEAMAELQAAGVPAGAVQRSSDLLRDPQLLHRGFFRTHAHTEMGEVPYEGHQFCIAGYDSGPRFAAPCLGEHSFEVMRDVLGMSEEEIAEVAGADALS